MNFEPQKLFIGLVDFFSVWLPGAILTFLLRDTLKPLLLGPRPLGEVEAWAIFLFGSYLAGHFIFLIGAQFDWMFYDRLHEATPAGQIRRLAKGKRRSWPTTRMLARRLFKGAGALPQVARIKYEQLRPTNAQGSINAYQWSRAKLALAHPDGLAMVDRFEADSKFFRSLCVVIVMIIAWQLLALAPVPPGWGIALPPPPGINPPSVLSFILLLLLLGAAFWRYAERRAKGVEQAYALIIAAECAPGRAPRPPASPGPDALTHAGGLVLRRTKKGVEYLLTESRDRPSVPVLPKGHIEPGEMPRETAVREVREETGLWARVHERLDDKEFPVNGQSIRVRFFLMELLKERKWKGIWRHGWLQRPKTDEPTRPVRWVPLDAATDELPFGEIRELIAAAGKRLKPARARPAPSPRSSPRQAPGRPRR